MKKFAELFTALDQTTSTIKKVDLLHHYFDLNIDEKDKIWVIAIFTHRRPARTVSTTLLRTWAAEIADIPLWLFEENYHIVGDLAETIALVLPSSNISSNYSLNYWIQYIKDLKALNDEAKKDKIISAWSVLDPIERMLFNKLITGGFRVGVSNKIIVKALSKHTLLDESIVMHKLMGNWRPESISWQNLLFAEDAAASLSRPYPFYLSYAIDANRDDEAIEILASEGISGDKWIAEWKWDGIRGQVIKRDGLLAVWSRGEELITEKFPEFEKLIQSPVDNFVLDGEITAFDEKPLSFNILQTRIGRKNLTAKILKEAPVKFIAYDILEYQGDDIRSLPFSERRSILEKMIKEMSGEENILLSPIHNFDSPQKLIEIRETARESFAEGLMLKSKSGPYLSGRKKGGSWKWKLDPYVIDAVMIYAQRGHGRRANLYSDFTFAVWDNDKLVPIAKAYSGLTDKEMNEVTSFVRRNTLEKFGPVSVVRPELVFEIAFEGIAASKRHKSGVALRFPRIKRWRKDKLAKDTNTIDELKGFIAP